MFGVVDVFAATGASDWPVGTTSGPTVEEMSVLPETYEVVESVGVVSIVFCVVSNWVVDTIVWLGDETKVSDSVDSVDSVMWVAVVAVVAVVAAVASVDSVDSVDSVAEVASVTEYDWVTSDGSDEIVGATVDKAEVSVVDSYKPDVDSITGVVVTSGIWVETDGAIGRVVKSEDNWGMVEASVANVAVVSKVGNDVVIPSVGAADVRGKDVVISEIGAIVVSGNAVLNVGTIVEISGIGVVEEV